MEGYCVDCGQMHLVEANNAEDATRLATERCDCESEAKWHRLMEANVEMLCGEKSRGLRFTPIDDAGVSFIKTSCELVHAGVIENIKIKVANSEITIKAAAEKVDIKRVRKQSNQLTI